MIQTEIHAHRAPQGVPGNQNSRIELDQAQKDIGRIGPVLLGVAAGTQAMLAAMLLVGRPLDPAVLEQLTDRGRNLFRPEYDMLFYLAGCLVSLFLAGALTWRAGRASRTAWYVSLTLAATIAFLFALRTVPPSNDPRPILRGVMLAGPGALAVLAAFVGLGRLPTREAQVELERDGHVASLSDRSTAMERGRQTRVDVPDGAGEARPRLFRDVATFWAVVLGIASVVMVPSCRGLAGKFVVLDNVPFHHWDFFLMGPALRYVHGGALGTDIYSQYGVAWPVLFAWLSPVLPLSYGNALAVFILCGTAYFVGLFLVLRMFLGQTLWAAAGVALAIFVQMHHGVHPEMTVWLTPSSSVLRSPMDVWFFLALLLHRRSGRDRWAVIAGALVGLGILFETDTGLYLVATLVFYLACNTWQPSDAGEPVTMKRRVTIPLASLAALALTTLCGLAVASRGTLLHREFWVGWLEPLRIYGGGMSAMRMSTEGGIVSLILFLAVVGTYLMVLGVFLTSLPGKRVGLGLRLGGCLSVYGLCLLLQYVNRSHEFNLYHGCIPFGIIAIAVMVEAHRRLAARWPKAILSGHWIPATVLALMVVTLALNPGFRAYPHVWNRLIHGKGPKGLSLMPGVSGFPSDRRGQVVEFRAIVQRLSSLRQKGYSLGVLDPADTMYYLASGCLPQGRYPSLMTHIIRKDQLEREGGRLAALGLDYWVVREHETKENNWGDVRRALTNRLVRDYVREDQIGSFGVWRSRVIRATDTANTSHRIHALKEMRWGKENNVVIWQASE